MINKTLQPKVAYFFADAEATQEQVDEAREIVGANVVFMNAAVAATENPANVDFVAGDVPKNYSKVERYSAAKVKAFNKKQAEENTNPLYKNEHAGGQADFSKPIEQTSVPASGEIAPGNQLDPAQGDKLGGPAKVDGQMPPAGEAPVDRPVAPPAPGAGVTPPPADPAPPAPAETPAWGARKPAK